LAEKVSVDAVIAGAQRSGTTWLARVLSQHPSIALANNKEAHLFDRADVQESGLSREILMEFFPGSHDEKLWLDATPSYLYLAGCLEALKASNPDVKVIVILRNPGQRALSHYYHCRWLSLEPKSLLGALVAEPKRLRAGRHNFIDPNSPHRTWSYLDRGRYRRQIGRLLKLFPQALVVPFPKIISHPNELLIDVQRYLGVEIIHLEILPVQNKHEARPSHTFLSKLISLLLEFDTRSTRKLLGWKRSDLNEGRRS
jgi:hypothetical protein